MGRRSVYLVVPLLLLAVALALRVADPQPVKELRYRSFDAFQALRPRPWDPATPVRIIELDEETLAREGQWPWPRTKVAELVSRLQAAGVAAIGLDILFAEPDRTSPSRIVPTWPETPETRALIDATKKGLLPDNDEYLAEAFRGGGVVTAFAVGSGEGGDVPARKAGFAYVGEKPGPYVPRFSSVVNTLPVLVEAASGNGTVTVTKDSDAILRRVPMLVGVDDQVFPSLAAEALRVAQGASSYVVKGSGAAGVEESGADTGIVAIKVGHFSAPTDPRGRLLLYDTGPVPERFIPAWRVMEGALDTGALEGTIVFVGATAAGLHDRHATPLMASVPGVVQHAQVVEQILQETFLHRPAWAEGAEILYLAGLGATVLLSFAVSAVGARWAAVFGLAVVPVAFGFAWYSFREHGFLLDPLYPSVGALAVYMGAAITSYLRSEGERRQVRQAFRQYLSPALVDQIAADPSKLRLGGETRDLTILFSDIRGFTTLSEKLGDAERITRVINRFLTPMTGILMDHQGTIDKYIGDAIMCFWNAPVDDPDHARHALEAALAMQAGLAELNATWVREAAEQGEPFDPLRIGLGINSGRCSVGNMGSDQRFDYSALGDSVNLASRLEGQSKTYGVDIVVGEATLDRAPGFGVLELDQIRVKGKKEPVRIFTLLGPPELQGDADFQRLSTTHGEMLAAYRRQDWDEAEALLEACREQVGDRFSLGPLYDLYAERIETFRRQSPGSDWDGVFVAVTK